MSRAIAILWLSEVSWSRHPALRLELALESGSTRTGSPLPVRRVSRRSLFLLWFHFLYRDGTLRFAKLASATVAELPTLVLFGAQRHTAPSYSVFCKTLRINLSAEDGSYSQMGSWANRHLGEARGASPHSQEWNVPSYPILEIVGEPEDQSLLHCRATKRMDTRTTGGPALKR